MGRRLIFHFLLARDVLFSRWGFLTSPFKFIVVVTKKCNSRCKNCFIWTEKPENELTLDEYRKVAQNSPQLKWLNLTGGEVSLREDVVEVVRLFKNHCPHLEMLNFTTNGIDPEAILRVVQELKTLDFLYFNVNVSLDGDSKVHNRLRGVSGNFENALRTFDGLREIGGVTTHFSFTIYNSNVHSFDAMLEEVRQERPWISLHDFHLNLENTSAHFYHRDRPQVMRTSEEDRREVKITLLQKMASLSWRSFTSFSGFFKMMYHRLAIRFLQTQQTPVPCQALMNSVYLSEHGEVFPCVVWSQSVGSLRDVDFDLKAIWASNRRNELRHQIVSKNCQNCWTPCEAYHSLLTSPLGG